MSNKQWEQGTTRGFANYLTKKCRERSRKRKHTDFELTVDIVEELIKPLVCEVTGLKLKLDPDTPKDRFAPSIDRIDNTRGYSVDNVRCTAYGINIMRNEFSNEEVDTLAKAWLARERRNSFFGKLSAKIKAVLSQTIAFAKSLTFRGIKL